VTEKREQLVEGSALRLRATFRALNQNQTQIAKFLGVASNRINQYANAERLADLLLMIRLCERFGITLDWIYRGDPSGVKANIVDAVIAAYHDELNHPSQSHKKSSPVKKASRHAA
jgi:transcriptional regulator with XRE-family HTH domain